MSHQSEHESKDMSELKLMERAIKDLGGTIVQASTYQGYGRTTPPCTHKIEFPDCRYDIGLTCEGNTITKMSTDWWGGDVEKIVGKKYAKLEKFYAVNKLEVGARKNGLRTRRKIVNNEIHLSTRGW